MITKILTIENAYTTIDALLASHSLVTTKGRTPFWVFNHLAQSTEYSIIGYPKMQPKWVQMSLGKWLFTLFCLRGEMSHNLMAPIPGAPPIPEEGDWKEAVKKFKNALQQFQQYNGKLAPHFMYGALTKEDYTRAHLMHFMNHLKLIETQP